MKGAMAIWAARIGRRRMRHTEWFGVFLLFSSTKGVWGRSSRANRGICGILIKGTSGVHDMYLRDSGLLSLYSNVAAASQNIRDAIRINSRLPQSLPISAFPLYHTIYHWLALRADRRCLNSSVRVAQNSLGTCQHQFKPHVQINSPVANNRSNAANVPSQDACAYGAALLALPFSHDACLRPLLPSLDTLPALFAGNAVDETWRCRGRGFGHLRTVCEGTLH